MEESSETIPFLLPCDPTSYSTIVDDLLEDFQNEEEQTDEALQWGITLLFSKGFSEKELEKAFEHIINAKAYVQKPPGEDLPVIPTVFAGGVFEGDTERIPLFIGVVDEIEKEMKRTKRKQKKIFTQLLFREVTFWVRLLNGHEQMPPPCCDDESCGHDEEEDEHEHHHGPEPELDHFEPELLEEKDLELFQKAVTACAQTLDGRVRIKPDSSIKVAAKRAEAIAETIDYCDNPLTIQLNWANNISEMQQVEVTEGFKGLDVWDALLSVGLEYDADRQAFELADDDQLYFTAPENAMRVMVSVASNFQKRLGGHLMMQEEMLDENKLKKQVLDILQKMLDCNIKPGSAVVAELF